MPATFESGSQFLAGPQAQLIFWDLFYHPVIETDSQSASQWQPASQSVSQSANQTTKQSNSHYNWQPASQSAYQPVTTTDSQSASQPVRQSANQTINQSNSHKNWQPVSQSMATKQPIRQPTSQTVIKSGIQPYLDTSHPVCDLLHASQPMSYNIYATNVTRTSVPAIKWISLWNGNISQEKNLKHSHVTNIMRWHVYWECWGIIQ